MVSKNNTVSGINTEEVLLGNDTVGGRSGISTEAVALGNSTIKGNAWAENR